MRRKRRNLVKQDPIVTKSIDTLRQIQSLPMLVKQDSIALQKKIKQNQGLGKIHKRLSLQTVYHVIQQFREKKISIKMACDLTE